MTVAKRLLEVRKSIGITQSNFAKKFDLSSRAYASYELGERELPMSFILKLHDELSIYPTWLLTGNGSRTAIEKKEVITSAVAEVQSFALEKNAKFKPDQVAKLVYLLVEYFEQVGEVDEEFASKMLELQT